MDQIELINHLSQFVTDERFDKLQKTSFNRTRHIAVVLEDLFQSHNASAVLRSCDCFGIQNINVIENINEYNINNDVSMGAEKWLDIKHYNKIDYKNNTVDCIYDLKQKGYKIVATTPHKNDFNLEEFPVDQKIALMFGTELNGLSDTAIEMADYYLQIPMYGFAESFNISVSAALCLHDLTHRIRKSNVKWQLPENERCELLINWLKLTINKSELIVDEFLKNK
ncbi:MAG: RNA methyltransferase [Bacteroidota bacterium]